MTRPIDTLTDDEVAAYIEMRRHRPRRATGYDIHAQRMKWAVEEIRGEERVRWANLALERAVSWEENAHRAEAPWQDRYQSRALEARAIAADIGEATTE